MTKPSVILIGTSAGGVAALNHIFARLPKLFQFPIVVVQHIPPTSSFDLELVFGKNFAGHVQEAFDKVPTLPGNIYFAPPNYHLLIEEDLSLALSQDELVSFARPSINVFFESAAESLGERGLGILLTGANDDGASGLRDMHLRGAHTIVQAPASAENSAMPSAALALFKPDHVMDLDQIATFLNSLSDSRNR